MTYSNGAVQIRVGLDIADPNESRQDSLEGCPKETRGLCRVSASGLFQWGLRLRYWTLWHHPIATHPNQNCLCIQFPQSLYHCNYSNTFSSRQGKQGDYFSYPLRRNDYQNNSVNIFSCNCPGAITGFSCRAPEKNSPKIVSCMGPCPVGDRPVIAPGALTGFSCRAPEKNSKIIFPACNHFESEGMFMLFFFPEILGGEKLLEKCR